MAKLHVFRERSGELGDNAELRGLDDPSLFRDSGIWIRLLVRGFGDSAALVNIARNYGLVVEATSDVVRFGTQSRVCGEHKLSALRAFFCAIEVARTDARSSSLLMARNGMRELLAGNKVRAVPEDKAIVSTWSRAQSRISIEPMLSTFLRQAGLQIGDSEGLIHLGNSELNGLHERILANSAGVARQRQAG